MPCTPPQHFPVSYHLSFGLCIEVLPFNIYHNNYCNSGTGPFSFTVIQVVSSPKEIVPVTLPSSQPTITKTINRQDRSSDGVSAISLFTYCTEYFGLVGESGRLTYSFEKFLLGGCPHHLFQKICWDSSHVQDAWEMSPRNRIHKRQRVFLIQAQSSLSPMASCAKYNVYALTGMMRRQFLVLGMLTRKGHANNCRGKPLRLDLVLATENTVHCIWPGAQKLQRKKEEKKKTKITVKCLSLQMENVCEEQLNYFLMCNASWNLVLMYSAWKPFLLMVSSVWNRIMMESPAE